MNSKLKTLLVLSGAVLLSVPALQAQRAVGGVRSGGVSARPALASRPTLASRPALTRSAIGARGAYTNARPVRGGGYYGRGGYYHGYGHGYGRYYYLGGIPYFYPFYGYGYGFGFPGYYGDGFYGGGLYGPYGSEGAGYADRANEGEGRINDGHDIGRGVNGNDGSNNQDTGNSLPAAVQRQLSKRGYYKGTVDGQFGPASRDALSRFQKSQGLKTTGRIDENTLDALGFTDQR